MKKYLILIGAVVILLLVADIALVNLQAGSIKSRFNSEDFLAAAASSVETGMPMREVESRIAGYRIREEYSDHVNKTVEYGYWFGFIPPLSKSGFKFAGGIVVEYSSDGRAVEASHWYN